MNRQAWSTPADGTPFRRNDVGKTSLRGQSQSKGPEVSIRTSYEGTKRELLPLNDFLKQAAQGNRCMAGACARLQLMSLECLLDVSGFVWWVLWKRRESCIQSMNRHSALTPMQGGKGQHAIPRSSSDFRRTWKMPQLLWTWEAASLVASSEVCIPRFISGATCPAVVGCRDPRCIRPLAAPFQEQRWRFDPFGRGVP